MIVSLKNASPEGSARDVGAAARSLRLAKNLTQETLSERAGVPVATLRRFERTGLAPFLTVVRLAHALSCEEALERLFAPPDALPDSLDEMLAEERSTRRQRASRKR